MDGSGARLSPEGEGPAREGLELTLLGGFSARWQGEAVTVHAPRMLALLAYLHLRGPASRQELEDVFWPGQGAAAVRQGLYTLRRLPGSAEWLDAGSPVTGSPVIGSTVTLHAASDAARVRAHLERGEDAAALAGLRAGPLLGSLHVSGAPEFMAWLAAQREDWLSLEKAALRRQGQALLAAGQPARARALLTRLVDLDPLDEASSRELMRLDAASGQLAGALATFETLRRVLRAEVGSEPEAETLALLRELEGPALGGQPRGLYLERADLSGIEEAQGPLQGRAEELADLRARLAAGGRVLVQGLAGMGKSRLAWAAVTQELAADAGGAALWLELGDDPAPLLWANLLETLGERGAAPSTVSPAERLAQALRGRGVRLAVLDNAANSYALSVLLAGWPPEVPVLVTSRLRLPRLPTLSLGRLDRASALRLLAGGLRAGGLRAGEAKEETGGEAELEADPATLDALCAVLGDHPYALRLAARTLRTGKHTPRRLLRTLSLAPHALGEERSVRALLAQSVGALGPASYEAYLGLGSLFAPRTTPELLALALRRPLAEAEEALHTLLERGLTVREARRGSDAVTYAMHELTWHDARAHAALLPGAVLAAARTYAQTYSGRPDLLADELPNLLGAAEYARQSDREGLVTLLAGWLGGPYIGARGFPLGHLSLLQDAAEHAEAAQDWERGALLWGKLGDIAQALQGDPLGSVGAYLRGAGLAARGGLTGKQATLTSLAGSMQAKSRLPEAETTLRLARRLAGRSGDPLCHARVLDQQAVYAAMAGDFHVADERLTQARAVLLPLLEDPQRSREIRAALGPVTSNLGQARWRLGQPIEALALKRESLRLAQEGDEHLHVARAQLEVGELLLALGEHGEARTTLQAALAGFRALDSAAGQAAVAALLQLLPPDTLPTEGLTPV
ncbi:DNA-binding transcriptional activator of the SARP family [Deinococcus reticulitermitis]|uniref:DNA-binding transcriptional activator of the SARP family n=1 Tax=Deinococcus reticulitermitis TaxID=856736 RepID=A0A1H6YU35_9DEIO|nr:BTAD domain-containing putative transcriptional regulator [Deinococcus reticulitermitis]SEJ40790.1 DNA-binding transcriptional activator of the SARP family [Deinococcus reticulitermitis]